ncbi:LacI family transcriptional regulator [Sphingomonas metalli]|uniref:LacI family transcriptional regulator n=1 Tax=Sphingomonas metalli TaxID=1779358 RepID=A0A916WWV4_9SPHN|nr:LacI family DNA-binding transcriptional regulator [Sphingomonas metalli]GGB36214.1 LacI family transcriptional regulator [Sphingomonas metalli]
MTGIAPAGSSSADVGALPQGRRHTRPTMADVAKAAGVSMMTVSRVINGGARVSASTQQVVDRAIRQLGYAPNAEARYLASTRRMRVALLYGEAGGSWLDEVLAGSADEGRSCGSHVVAERYAPEGDGIRTAERLVAAGVNGLILAPPLHEDRDLRALIARLGVPAVALGTSEERSGLPSIGIDDAAASTMVTEHLLRLGHRRIGLIAGDPANPVDAARIAGYRQALEAAGVAADAALIAPGCASYRAGLRAAETLLDLARPPTALFACSDEAAAAAIAIAHGRGIDVPADLTVCGFGDAAIATVVWPRLTTVRQPLAEMARLAVRMLYQPPQEGEPHHVTVACTLIRRQSDCVPRLRMRSVERQDPHLSG